MNFEAAVSAAAHAADDAVASAMRKLKYGRVVDEDDLTGYLVGQLDAKIDGQIGGLHWSSSILRHRGGKAAHEKKFGADILIHVQFDTSTHFYSKGILIQAKRANRDTWMSPREHSDLIAQCNKMLAVTPAAFVFDYTPGEMRCGSALKISGTKSRNLFAECDWTSYRFFLELFRCPIGDPKFTSANILDFDAANVLALQARGDLG